MPTSEEEVLTFIIECIEGLGLCSVWISRFRIE